MASSPITSDMRDRARGVLLGQFVGDALGTTVEFSSAEKVRQRYPDGLREVIGGGPFHVEPGQVTDDGELALALARCLVAHGSDLDARARAYAAWYASGPFDVGTATGAAFGHWANVTASAMLTRADEKNGAAQKQANGALMRISPLAIHGAFLAPATLVERAREDARLSHPSPVCQAANAAFVRAIQVGLHGGTRVEACQAAREAAADCADVAQALGDIADQPGCEGTGQGWVLVALRNAFHVLVHEDSFEEALVRTVMAGGDADTNACIAGALLGAFHGLAGIPPRWVVKVLACRTGRGATYQTTDAIVLADELLERGLAFATANAAPERPATIPAAKHKPAQPGHTRPPRPSATPAPGVRTSLTHPIRVDWLSPQRGAGKVGITIAPGKHSNSREFGGRWERDLDIDLRALKDDCHCDVLVCLLEPEDLTRLKIPDLERRARALAMEVIRFPIRDVSVPPDTRLVHELVTTLQSHVRDGRNVVIHCEGGLGRSGVIAGCYLATEGLSASQILEALQRARGRHCPETEAQRGFIREFARECGCPAG
jgi:ADP-ribosylglycohydrolase